MDECNCGHVCLHLVLKAATILGEQHEPAQERGRHEPGRQDRCAFASTAHHPREICASEAWLSHIAGDVVANPHVTDCACKDWTPRGEDLETVIDAVNRVIEIELYGNKKSSIMIRRYEHNLGIVIKIRGRVFNFAEVRRKLFFLFFTDNIDMRSSTI